MFRCLIICFVFETLYFVPFPPWQCSLQGSLTGHGHSVYGTKYWL